MKREKSRECTFLLLFSNDFHEANEVAKQLDMLIENQNDINENKEDPIIAKEADREYITARVIDIEKNIEEIDKKINEVAVGWSTERMSKVDLTILRLAYYEMKMDEEVPVGVAINEAVELAKLPQKVAIDQAINLAKKYGGEESSSFVNGILAKLY